MTWIELVAASLALAAAVLLLAGPRLRRRRLRARSPARVLFPFLGTSLSRSTLDAALRLAQADSATLVPAYIATVPMNLSLEAPTPRECETAMPLLDAIERRATRLEVPVDSRIERGRSPRHALTQVMANERFDRIVVPAQTSSSDGFEPDDIAWLLEHAPGEVVVLRPGSTGNRRPTQHALAN
jgi:nucleotide-binding universal stress UspA family protein